MLKVKDHGQGHVFTIYGTVGKVKDHGQGHVFTIYGTIGKVLS